MWGEGQVCEKYQLSLFDIFAKKWGWSKEGGGKKTKIVMHLKQKPTAKLNNGLFGFVKVQKNPMVQDSYSRRFMSVDLLSHSFKQKVSISLSGRWSYF